MSDILKFQSNFKASLFNTSLRDPLGQYSVKINITGQSIQAPTNLTVFSWDTSLT